MKEQRHVGGLQPSHRVRAQAGPGVGKDVAPSIDPSAVATWVVQSLYLDEAYPRAPLIQWYYLQLLGIKFQFGEIKSFLENAPGVYLEPQSGKKSSFAAALVKPPEGFVGFSSDGDPGEIKEDILDAISVCLAKGGWPAKDVDLQHKYFVVANWLQDHCTEVAGMSFGKLLAIVKSCAQPSGLGFLGHRNGLVVPYATSEDCERRINAATGKPTAVARDEEYVRTWDELIGCLKEHLTTLPDQMIEVSKVKSMFRHTFKRELSETVFGYEGLTKLLSDERMTQHFAIEARSHTYVLKYHNGENVIMLKPGALPDLGLPKPPGSMAVAKAVEKASLQLQ